MESDPASAFTISYKITKRQIRSFEQLMEIIDLNENGIKEKIKMKSRDL